jgi:hypothetical protein
MFPNNINNNNTSNNNVNNITVSTVTQNSISDFDNEIVTQKAGICNTTNSILASATASISTHNQPSRTSPSSGSQHRISIQVKVEENSASSNDDNSNGDCNSVLNPNNNNSISSNWPGACIYRCNISSDSRRYIYNEDKCVEAEVEPKNHDNETNHLIALRDQFLCPGSAFSTNTQQNGQHYIVSDNCKILFIKSFLTLFKPFYLIFLFNHSLNFSRDLKYISRIYLKLKPVLHLRHRYIFINVQN